MKKIESRKALYFLSLGRTELSALFLSLRSSPQTGVAIGFQNA